MNNLDKSSKPVAEVNSKYGDPEAFGERELKVLADIQEMPYGAKFYSQMYVDYLIAQLEAAHGSIKALESKVNHYVAAEYAHKHFDQTPDIIKRADSAELELVKVKAALSAANEKLSKPVVLPPRRSASSFVDEEFSNKDLAAIYNAARIEFSVKITNAGFTVEDE